MKHLGILGLTLALSGCSLIKLSDDIGQAKCQSDTDCDALNDRDASDFNPCRVWQCAETDFCEQLPLDGDHDGQSPGTATHGGEEFVCEEDPSKQDCDDSDEDRNAGLSEACDGVDNDCDELVDEDALDSAVQPVVVFAGDNAGGPSSASYANDVQGGSVGIAYSIDRNENRVPGFSKLIDTLDEVENATALQSDELASMRSDVMALAALGSDEYVVAFHNQSGEARLVAGLVTGSQAKIQFDSDVAVAGLCETCGTVVGLSAASGDPGVAIGYVDSTGDDSDACGELVGAPSPPSAFVQALRKTGGALVADGLPVDLGPTSDLGGPAVLALSIEEASGWLAASADANGALTLHWLTDGEEPMQVLNITHGNGPLSGAALALAEGPDGTRVGLAYRRGCGSDSHVGFQLFEANADGAVVELSRLADHTEVGETNNESDAALAYSEARDSWMVVYRDARGLGGRLLTADGALRGVGPQVLINQMGTGVGVLPSPGVVAATDGNWFTALAATNRSEAEDPLGIDAVHIGNCEN